MIRIIILGTFAFYLKWLSLTSKGKSQREWKGSWEPELHFTSSFHSGLLGRPGDVEARWWGGQVKAMPGTQGVFTVLAHAASSVPFPELWENAQSVQINQVNSSCHIQHFSFFNVRGQAFSTVVRLLSGMPASKSWVSVFQIQSHFLNSFLLTGIMRKTMWMPNTHVGDYNDFQALGF